MCTKGGKALLSRQFVEMTKSRIEGLLAAFPKLLSTSTASSSSSSSSGSSTTKQHTFVETESVRYVYQPMEKMYMLLITTKTSNILEDLETLRLFARVLPEYCRNMDEADILDNAFNLIFAFDEIVALGYRESVNLAQIRTFVEMDSHEEKVYQAVRQTQEREAKQKMREKAKELQRQKMEMQVRLVVVLYTTRELGVRRADLVTVWYRIGMVVGSWHVTWVWPRQFGLGLVWILMTYVLTYFCEL